MQMTDLPTSKAQLVLFIINNFNNCINLNTYLFFQCMIVRANIYVLPNLFPILNYNKSVVQADLFKLRLSLSKSGNQYRFICICLKKKHGHEKDIKITTNQIELLVLSCQNPGMGEIGIKNHEYLIAIILFRIFNGRS